MEYSHHSTSPLESRDSTLISMPMSASSIATGDHTTDATLSPVHRVLETPELLENILAYLPYTHKASPLELCRRVNRFFCNTINHSLMLQRNLFLKSNGRYCNSSERGSESWFEFYKGRMFCCNHEMHPLLLRTEPNPDSDFTAYFYIYNFTEPGYVRNHPVEFDLHRFTQTFENVSGLCDDSSIHKMFLTNPPIKVVEIRACIELVSPYVEEYVIESYEEYEERLKLAKYPQSRCSRGDILTSDEGITFGQLFEYTKEMVAGLKKEDVHPYRAPPFASGSCSADWESESEWSNEYLSDREEDWETDSEQ
jgi:hypothetical protein